MSLEFPTEGKNSIRHLDGLLSIQDEWLDIHRHSVSKAPFLSFAFLRLWYDCFAVPDQVRIYRVTDGESTIGFLPLVLRGKKRIRVLESLTNDHCFHSDPLVRVGYEDVFPELLLKGIVRDSDHWDVFLHRFSYSFSRFPGLFSDDLLARSGMSWQRKRRRTHSILVRRPFDEYYHGDLSSELRKVHRKYKNRLSRAGRVDYRHFQGADAIRVWPEFVRIEGSGWKGKAGTSIDKTGHNFQRYYQGLVELLADQEALHLFFVDMDGKRMAGGFGYTERDTFHAFKTGYDERFKRYSPGNLLRMHMIEHVTENCSQIRRFHMFPWDYGYKQRYVNETSYCMETRLFSRTLRGKTAYLFSRTKEAVKHAVYKAHG